MEMLRDSPLGQILRLVSKKGALLYPEERPGFVLPWEQALSSEKELDVHDDSDVKPTPDPTTPDNAAEGDAAREEVEDRRSSREQDLDLEKLDTAHSTASGNARITPTGTNLSITRTMTRERTLPFSSQRFDVERAEEIQREKSIVIVPQRTSDGVILVDWYTTDDPENPQNWKLSKKIITTMTLFWYTFSVYCASAIYTPSEEGVMEVFNVGVSKAALGLSMYVLGYGFGPMLFSPLSEIPLLGRNIPYITTFSLFFILGIPTALVDNYPGLLVLRFLTGFLGSPCLATGGATVQDLYSFVKLPYGLMAWTAATFCAPALGPLLSGFAVMNKGWRWSLWEIVWMSAPGLIAMYIAFPETSAANILLRRAQRLRKLTGNSNFRSQSEIDQKNLSFRQVAAEALIKPMQITLLDPSVLFTNVYSAFIYGTYYSFFEAFPIVYTGIYGFNAGEIGVAFTNIVVSCVIGIAIFFSYVYWYLEPDLRAHGPRQPEHRLVPALFATMGLPVGLFIFAWTSRASIHWIVSIIGIAVFATSAFVLFQCIFMYLPLSYPQYAASLFAANDLWRSCLAAGAIIFARPLFLNLGIGRGVSLLGGLTVMGVLGIWALWLFGAKLRAKSKFAQS